MWWFWSSEESPPPEKEHLLENKQNEGDSSSDEEFNEITGMNFGSNKIYVVIISDELMCYNSSQKLAHDILKAHIDKYEAFLESNEVIWWSHGDEDERIYFHRTSVWWWPFSWVEVLCHFALEEIVDCKLE